MSRKKRVYGSYRNVNNYALLRAYGKSKVDGVKIRNKSIEEHLCILSWYESPQSSPQRSWKYQTKNRKQWMKKS